MRPTISADLYGDLVQVASQPGFRDWQAMVRNTGGCAEPVHLWGESRTIHTATGELLTQREPGRLLVACGNRRTTRCPSCSETYRADTFQLIKAGLVGGKTVPETVARHPKVFATFTAPSFGPVHHRVAGANGRINRCHPYGPVRCRQRHRTDDPGLGQPLDPDSYDYVGAVMWNALSTRLWARTVQLVSRHVARLLGIAQRVWPQIGRISVAKVAEYQARGVVHFHAIFRLDGPQIGDPPPNGIGTEMLCEAIRQGAIAARVQPPVGDALDTLSPAVWGDELDLRPVRGGDSGDPALTNDQVAGYLAKYATKGAEASGTVDRPIACRRCRGTGRYLENDKSVRCSNCKATGARIPIDRLTINPHATAMINTCWELGGLPQLRHMRLRPWAHMLGFRGHFATKSRRYSVTLGCLRGARRHWRTAHTLTSHGLDPAITPVRRLVVDDLGGFDASDRYEDSVLVVGNWCYAGRGHTPGQAVYARTIAHDLAESRRIGREHSRDEEF